LVKEMNKPSVCKVIVMLIITLLLTACTNGAPADQTREPSGIITPVIPTDTLALTKTPTADSEDVILIVPPESESEVAIRIEEALKTLAQQANLSWKKVASIQEEGIHASLRVVIALGPDPGLAQLAKQMPQVQFLGVGIEDLEISDNVSRITAEGMRQDIQGFLAGYMAAMIAPDWRAGVISHTGNGEGRAAGEGFMQGARYFCGQCRPSFPPFTKYPIALNLASPESPWEAGVREMLQKSVKVVYIYPEIDTQTLRDSLAIEGVAMIGGNGHPEGIIQEYWVASVRPDPSGVLMEIWESLIRGEGGISKPMPLVLEDVNRAWLSEGKERLVMAVVQEIFDGFLDTGVDPKTGELR
jgi:hypothetical protein